MRGILARSARAKEEGGLRVANGKRPKRRGWVVGLVILLGLIAWYTLTPRQATQVTTGGAEGEKKAAETSPPSGAPATPAAPAASAPQQAQAPAAAAPSAATPAQPAPQPTPAQAAPAAPAAPAGAAPATPSAPAAPVAAAPSAAPAAKPETTPPAAPQEKAAAAKPEKKAEPTKAKAGGEAPSELAQIQRLLDKLGYEPGPADGQMRGQTTRAIRLFQGDTGLKVDGRPTKELLAYMKKLAGTS